MKFLVVGYGRVGRAVALNLKAHGHQVEVVDIKVQRESFLDGFHVIDVSKDLGRVSKLATEFDCTCSCLPGRLGYRFMDACAEHGIKLVDVSFTCEDPLSIDSKARKARSTIIPDCGIAPGLTNMIVGLISRVLDQIYEVEIKVGGLPLTPNPPLYHSSSWSIEDLLEEYARPARYVEDGILRSCDPLSFRTSIKIGDWDFEAFPSDGLRTLLRMKKRPSRLVELTLRWRGHLDVIKFLKDLGFLGEEKIEIGGINVTIRELTAKILEKTMKYEPDVVVIDVDVRGIMGKEPVKGCLMVYGSAFDENLSSMAKATGVVCSEVALLLSEGQIDCEGVIPPEDLDNLELVVKRILKKLKILGFRVENKGLDSLGLTLGS
ncbi:MAG: saccharopine dehydrogenase C-terminal domain-containing protein [Candidatus Nezhaarchaeales archaeon]